MEWVSVKDKLPVDSGTVLVAIKCGECYYIATKHYDAHLKVWYDTEYGEEITHWMLLPDIPHEIANDRDTVETEIHKRLWTDKDLSDARAIKQLKPDAEKVERLVEKRGLCNTIIRYKDGRTIGFRIDIIPSLNPGESVLLDEILKDAAQTAKEDDTVDANTIPRICGALGVEVGEEWSVEGTEYDTTYRISMSGNLQCLGGDGRWRLPSCGIHASDLVAAINYPEMIQRKPRWSTEDIADAKAVKRIWPDTTKVQRLDDATIQIETPIIRGLPSSMFPSLKVGGFCNLDSVLEVENRHE